MQTSPMQGVPQMMPGVQVIALPVGAPPPEGAIAIAMAEAPADQSQFPIASGVGSSQVEPQKSRAFKIKDPRTGREVQLPSNEEAAAASRRLRIVNPKTGEEVLPNL